MDEKDDEIDATVDFLYKAMCKLFWFHRLSGLLDKSRILDISEGNQSTRHTVNSSHRKIV